MKGRSNAKTDEDAANDLAISASPWNLNNMPVSKYSLLRHIGMNISGMKVPWLYAGMLYSCFCWHTEDHWTYSINYLHWGAPKIWYGVPSSDATKFESVMKSIAPELFESQPDLLHQLVTMLSPEVLVSNGVKVCWTEHHAGEFVVTFPRAYHAGYNSGLNFAEAVNFATWDWLEFGLRSMHNYQLTQRAPVFSHEEVICYIAQSCVADPTSIDCRSARIVFNQLTQITEAQYALCSQLVISGLTSREHKVMETLADDDRQCCVCKGTCFLFSIQCSCKPASYTCLEHAAAFCQCPAASKTIVYRFEPASIREFLEHLDRRALVFEEWKSAAAQLQSAVPLDDGTPATSVSFDAIAEHLRKIEADWVTDVEVAAFKAKMNGIHLILLEADSIHAALSGERAAARTVTLHEIEAVTGKVNAARIECAVLPIIMEVEASAKALETTINQFLESVLHKWREQLAPIVVTDEIKAAIGEDMKLCNELLDRARACKVDLGIQAAKLERIMDLHEWKVLAATFIAETERIEPAAIDEVLQRKPNDGTFPDLAAIASKEKNSLHALRRSSAAWAKRAQMLLASMPDEDVLRSHLSNRTRVISLTEERAVEVLLQQIEAWQTRAAPVLKYLNQFKKFRLAASKGLAPEAQDALSQNGILSEEAEDTQRSDSPEPMSELPRPDFAVVEALVRDSQNIKAKIPAVQLLGVVLSPAHACLQQLRAKLLRQEDKSLDTVLCRVIDARLLAQVKIARAAAVFRNGQVPPIYCLCKSSNADGFMVQCDVCTDWFHGKCVIADSVKTEKAVGFVCCNCNASLRPHVKYIRAMLPRFQSLKLECHEEEMLQRALVRFDEHQAVCQQRLSDASNVSIEHSRSHVMRLIEALEHAVLSCNLLPFRNDGWVTVFVESSRA